MDSDDDSLDELLNGPPVFSLSQETSTNSNSNSSTTNPPSNNTTTSSTDSSDTVAIDAKQKVVSKGTLLERATQKARAHFKVMRQDIRRIPKSSNDIRWFRSSSGGTPKFWPVVVESNPEALAAGLKELEITSEKQIVVRHLGLQVTHKGDLQRVSKSQLLPFHVVGVRKGGGTTKRNFVNSAMTRQEGEIHADQEESSGKCWSKECMNNYVTKCIQNQQVFNEKPQEKELRLLVEQEYLRLFLEHVLEVEQTRQESMGDVDVEELEESSKSALLVHDVAQPDPSSPQPLRRQTKAEIRKLQSRNPGRLRAGDVIEYCSEMSTFNKRNMCTATVLEVHPREPVTCLQLSDGQFLRKSSRVRVVQRLRGKKQTTVDDSFFTEVASYKLDSSYNKKKLDNVKTVSDRVAELVDSANDHIEQEMVAVINATNNAASTDENNFVNHSVVSPGSEEQPTTAGTTRRSKRVLKASAKEPSPRSRKKHKTNN